MIRVLCSATGDCIGLLHLAYLCGGNLRWKPVHINWLASIVPNEIKTNFEDERAVGASRHRILLRLREHRALSVH